MMSKSTSTNRAMRVAVGRELCEANGLCVGLASEVFDLDDEDYLHILQPELPVDGLAKGSPGRPAAEAKCGDQSRSEKSDSLHVICSFDGRRLCVWSAGRMLS